MMTADGDVPAELSKLQQAYELLGELIRDELVTVYVARDRRSGQEVAIKVLRAADAHGREALAHYASDARMLTALDHPNIIAVHGVKWLSEDVVAVITERVRGPSLRQVLDVAGTLPVARATEVLRGLARALAWAHSSQVMHRDLRPENVIFEDRTGRVVLSDLGLARRIDVSQAVNEIADAYRAPELADGRYPDRRSDVFSLGVVGWELLTGRRPYPDDMAPLAPRERAPQPPPLAEVRPGLPPALVEAIEGAVQLERDRRIADVVTFMERLTTVAPPQREEADEEAADGTLLAPTEWVSLPVPRMPQRPSAPVADREIPRRRAAEPAATESIVDLSTAEAAAPPATPDMSTLDISTGVTSTPAGSTPSASSRDASATDVSAAGPSPADLSSAEVANGDTAPLSTANAGRLGRDVSAPPRRESLPPQAADIVVPGPRVGRESLAGRDPSERELKRAVEHETRRAEEGFEPGGPPQERRSEKVTPAESSRVPAASAGPAQPPRRMSKAERKRQTPPRDEPQRDEPQRDEPRARPSEIAAAGLAAGAAAAAAQARSTRDPSPVEPPRAPAPLGEPAKADHGRRDAPPAKPPLADAPESGAPTPTAPRAGAPLADALRSDALHGDILRGDSLRGDAPGAELGARAPFEPDERVAARWNKPLSDVELPPPEPVPFADTRAEPLTGPVTGPVHSQPRTVERFEPAMRGGLAAPRPPMTADSKARNRKLRGKKRDSGSMAAPAPLQPVWDTPAEFPLPVMPDPRPMPADVGRGAPTDARRRWTRRGIAIAAIVAVALIGVITLARMERAPDTTADLMRPESPIGYGGDVSLDPSAADADSGTGPTSARGGEGAGARRPSGPAATSPRTRNSGSSTTPETPATPPPTGAGVTPSRGATSAGPSRVAVPARSAPASERRAGTTSAATSRSSAQRTAPAAAVAASDDVVARPTGACGSPALADQRACLAAQIAASDAGLNEVYGDLIGAMRQRANSAPGDPDPPEVQRLRAVQRSWLARRDAECRRRGRGREGPLWATPRGRCLAEFSAERTRELSATLARLGRD